MNTIGMQSSLNIQMLVDMRAGMNDLPRQLATGKKADTYAGIGPSRGLTVSMRNQLSGIAGFTNTIDLVKLRVNVASTALTEIDNLARTAKQSVMQSQFELSGGGQVMDQTLARSMLDQMLGILNTPAGDRYVFSGKATDQPPVAKTDAIMDGDGARAGLRQVIDERRQADVGADGLGRLVLDAPAPDTVSLAEDAAGSPFGFKLESVQSSLSGATVSGPTGAPAQIELAFASNPQPGESFGVTFTLPDGSRETVTMTATASDTPGPGEFRIGATPDETAANVRAGLADSVEGLASTALTAASAVAAGDDFFNIDDANPPRRVDGPPFDTATALRDGTPADTVTWYTGEGGSDPARQTATGRVDQSMVVSYGTRANEEGIRLAIQNVAVYAAVTFSEGDPNAKASYEALSSRIGEGLGGKPGQQKMSDIQAEIAGAQKTADSAKTRHLHGTAMLENFLYEIEGVTPEEVAAKFLTLQTALQASLQTTSMMLQTNLLNYL